MPEVLHAFDWPDRFVVGTVGRPGSRAFYLQARTKDRIVSVALEKEQSAALAAGVDRLLDELMARDGNPFNVPAHAPDMLADDEALDEPIEDRFRVGTLVLGWDPTSAQVVIQAHPVSDDADEEESEPEEVFVVRIPVGAARAFARRTRQVVLAGRPPCPRCGNPMDPDHHVCPRPEGLP